MITMQSWRVNVPPGGGMLGYETETGVSRLAIQLDGTYEGWQFKLDTRREYSDLNVFDFVHDSDMIYFDIVDELGLEAGRYVCQVRGECGDKRQLSAPFSLYVAEAVGAIEVLENMPVAELYQLEQRLTALKTQCEQLARTALGQSESAVQAASSALESAQQALESAREADASRQTAMQAAEAAARDAGTSEAAAARAETARADALTASAAAEEAAVAAQAALTAAQEAAEAAQNAASAAATDRQAAEQASETATRAASAAAAESVRAAESASAAEESASTAAASAAAAAESERQAKASEEAATASAAASKLDAQATAADREAVAADKNAVAANRTAAETAAASAKTDAERIAALDTYSKSETDVLLSGKADQPYASAEGAFIHIADSAGGMLAGLRIYGKSIQDGTPNWDNPVPIESVGDAGTVTVTLSDSADDTQTITLQTPGGLLGVPVSSGGNYIDEAGQRWVCDEVDLAREVYVQRVAKHVVTGDEAWVFQVAGNGKRVFSFDFYKKHPWSKINKNSYDVMSNCCVASESIDVISKVYKYSDNIFIYGDFDSADAFKALAKAKYDAGNPLILYIGILPVERRLTSEEIAAYKALVTYDGTTVVQADGAGIQIVYRQTVIFRGSELLADVTISGLQELHIRSIDYATGVMELTEPLTIGSDGATLPGGFGGWGLGVDITKLQSLKNSVPKELLQKFGSYFDAVKRVDETHIQIPAFSSFTEPSALDLDAFWIAKSALVTLTDLPEFERLRFHVSTNGGTCAYIRLYDENNSVIYGYCGVQSGTYGSYNTRIPAVSASGLGVSEGVLDGNSTLVLSGRSLGFNAAGSFVSTVTEQNYAVFDREKKVKKIEIRAEYGQMLNGSRIRVWKEA